MESPEGSSFSGDGQVTAGVHHGRSDLTGLYHLGRTLGRGHYAVVKLARHVSTGQLVAIKMIDKTKLDIMATSHLLQEVRCMKLVQHPNVVCLYEVIDTPTTLYLIMELAEGGDLYDYILRHERGVAEGTAKRHFAQIVRAVSYCHELHVVHRDLKPENVVFFPQQGAVKLTDFGFSNLFQPGTMLATSCGSLAYSAPEILLGEEYDAPAVDIWSLGVILYMLVCGVPPFQETNDSETLVMILDCRYSVPDHVSAECRDLISRMLQKDPCQRASLKEIEAHRWLQGLDDALLSPEPLPEWLTGALSPSSPRSGAPECGDLLAVRPTTQSGFPGSWQPNLSLSLRPPPAEEPPVAKSVAALQQICEEEEEEEEEEEGEKVEEEEAAVECSHKEERVSSTDDCVISEQPISYDTSLACAQSHALDPPEGAQPEPNNNTDKSAQLPAAAAGPDLDPTERRATRDDLNSERQRPLTGVVGREDVPARIECGKRHSIKLRDRIFQFPLCEKALALNIPTHNKPKILPLAQYNCCHVL
ncbi:SNF related kinase b [Synchiropus splendidus]|uniref:SNF related kinase b n=1 Tax=Synchiropus splendidus TaxID=270530 RepID=UPI00237D3929|nr:SNF related kinase b [Synchiropus splendidus]